MDYEFDQLKWNTAVKVRVKMLYDAGSHSLMGWVGNRTLLADEPVQILVVPLLQSLVTVSFLSPS